MKAHIPFASSEDILQVLARLGRTEDIKFSPDNRKLAIAGFNANRILLLSISFEQSPESTTVRLTDYIELTSPDLHRPHGLCFINDDTLAVANREGNVIVFALPGFAPGGNTNRPLTPTIAIDPKWTFSPGSVTTYKATPGIYKLLVCNNYSHYVSSHTLHTERNEVHITDNKILLAQGLSIPDGVAISQDQHWIAISNHDAHCVEIFSNDGNLKPHTQSVGQLRDIEYPHGLCFTSDGKYLLVADAGNPCVRIYAQDEAIWSGQRKPLASPQIMSTDIFMRGRYNPQEGGPKGIDIDSDMRVLVTTCEHQVLAFFDLSKLLEQAKPTQQPRQEDNQMALRNQATARRTQACPCGSGKRFKHCCGQRTDSKNTSPAISDIKSLALQNHLSGNFETAERLYRDALAHDPNEADCLHMLSVVLYSRGRYTEASRYIRQAGTISNWSLPGITHNLGLIVGSKLTGRGSRILSQLRHEYDAWLETQIRSQADIARSMVSVLIPTHNSAAFIESTLESVFSQTYHNLELIVIDSGSTDETLAILRRILPTCPWPHRLLHSASRETHSLLCEAIDTAQGEYINPIIPGDQFDPTRIATLVASIANCGFEWGFSGFRLASVAGQAELLNKHARVNDWKEIHHTITSADTVGTSLLSEFNPVISISNIFFSKALFNSISDKVEAVSSPEMEYCLHMLWLSEPRYEETPLYYCRVPGNHGAQISANTLTDAALLSIERYHIKALNESPVNRFAPSKSTMGLDYLGNLLTSGLKNALTPETLLKLDREADELDRQNWSASTGALGHGLSIIGYFRGDFGLAEGVRVLASTCTLCGIPATFRDAEFSLGPRQSNRRMDGQLSEALPHKNILFYMNPDVFTPAWQRLKDRGELERRHTIGYWYWEIDAYPQKWLPALNHVDEIWVASEFVGSLIKRATSKPVHKIPYAIDVSLTRSYQRNEFGLPEGGFLFLFSFDFGSYAHRKNPWATIRAFQQAFPKDNTQVGLVIKCSLGYKHPEKLASLEELARHDPRIIILDILLSREDVYGLQSICDAYVSLHRSEGLGLGMAECMALGKPVIATGYSGNLEFMTPENSCLVNYTLIPIKPGEYAYYEPGWLWADADIDHAAAYMRRVVDDEAFRVHISQAAKRHMTENFNHQVVAQAIKKRLAELAR